MIFRRACSSRARRPGHAVAEAATPTWKAALAACESMGEKRSTTSDARPGAAVARVRARRGGLGPGRGEAVEGNRGQPRGRHAQDAQAVWLLALLAASSAFPDQAQDCRRVGGPEWPRPWRRRRGRHCACACAAEDHARRRTAHLGCCRRSGAGAAKPLRRRRTRRSLPARATDAATATGSSTSGSPTA